MPKKKEPGRVILACRNAPTLEDWMKSVEPRDAQLSQDWDSFLSSLVWTRQQALMVTNESVPATRRKSKKKAGSKTTKKATARRKRR